MAIEIVNTSPGTSPDLMKPGEATHISLKSRDGTITLGTLKASLGISNVRFHDVKPEDDPVLLDGTVALTVPEHQEPAGGFASISSDGGALSLRKTTNSALEHSVYEVTYPVRHDASVLAYFRLRKRAWSTQRPDLCYVPGIAAPYLGIRAGAFNSGAFLFFQDNGSPSNLVVGGPLQALRQNRPVQQSLNFDWASVPEGNSIEIWIFVNQAGLPPPYPTPYTPVVEVWKRVAGDEGPVLLTTTPIQISALGTFPFRTFEDTATIYLGNCGLTGDSVELEDWVLFPDYRLGVLEGSALPYHQMSVIPDGPLMFRADDGHRPDADYPGRWFRSTDAGSFDPITSFGFQPGRRLVPLTVDLTKYTTTSDGSKLPAPGHSVFERYEPRLGMQSEGFMLEAFMSGHVDNQERDAFGAGFEIDDGGYRFQVVMMKNALRQTYALAGVGPQPEITTHYLIDQDIDFTSLKLVRLVADRIRDELRIEVDDELVFKHVLSKLDLPPTAAAGKSRIRFGHIFDINTQGTFSLALLNYMQRFLSYEVSDGDLPESAVLYFDKDFSSDGSSQLTTADDSSQIVKVSKTAFGLTGTKAKYSRDYDFGENKGSFLEFKARVVGYINANGTPFAARSQVGAGVEVHLGNKLLRFGFFDCGLHGKKIGILPGSGTEQDIIEQTTLGRAFSASYDWAQPHSYRIIFLPYKRIEVWVESVAGEPAITIPWTPNGFDLPSESVTPHFSFGHLTAEEASTSEWSYIRWGSSNGYEVSLAQQYPHGVQTYQLDGRFLMDMSVEDYADGSGVVTNVNFTRHYVVEVFDISRMSDQPLGVFELPFVFFDQGFVSVGADTIVDKISDVLDVGISLDSVDISGTLGNSILVSDTSFGSDEALTVGDTYSTALSVVTVTDEAPTSQDYAPYSVHDTAGTDVSGDVVIEVGSVITDTATANDTAVLDALYDSSAGTDSLAVVVDSVSSINDTASSTDYVFVDGFYILLDGATTVDGVVALRGSVTQVLDLATVSDSIDTSSNISNVYDLATTADFTQSWTNYISYSDLGWIYDVGDSNVDSIGTVSDISVGSDSVVAIDDPINLIDTATSSDSIVQSSDRLSVLSDRLPV